MGREGRQLRVRCCLADIWSSEGVPTLAQETDLGKGLGSGVRGVEVALGVPALGQRSHLPLREGAGRMRAEALRKAKP